MTTDLITRIAAAKRAVLAQTVYMHAHLGTAESSWKADNTRVTAADIAISEGIFRDLSREFTSDQYFSEELAGADAPIPVTAEFAWVLDPIDGTNNYALGIPHCAISLGLFRRGEPVYGVVYDMSRRVLMHGGPGFGMFDGDRQTQVAPFVTDSPRHRLVGLHSPYDKSLLPATSAILREFKIRGLGSATLHLAYVAAGMFDGAADFNVKIWDLAAAIPMCRAAGGEVHFINPDVLPLRTFDLKMKRLVYVAGGPEICERLLLAMRKS